MASVAEMIATVKLGGVDTVQKQLKSLSDGVTKASKKIEDAGKKISDLGNKTKGLGESMMPMTAALTAIGVAGIKASEDIEGAISGFQTKMGASGKELEAFEGILSNVAKSGVGSFTEVSDAIVNVSQNMRGLQPDEIEVLTEQTMQLAKVMGSDVSEVSKTAGIMMSNFGMSGQEAMDLIAKGYQKGMDYSGDYLDTLSEYSVYFDQMGFSGQEMFNTLISGANAGAFNLDKVGDAVKEFNIRAKDGSDTTNEAFEALGFNASSMGKKFAEGGEGAQQAMQEVVEKLSGVENQQERNAIGVALFGTQYEDMEGDVIAALGSVRDHLGDYGGTAAEVAEQNKTFTQEMMGYWNELQEIIKPVGDVLKDVISIFAEQAMPVIRDLAERFNGLSENSKKWIVVLGLAAAALPLLLVGLGSLLIFVGNAITAVGLITGKFALMGKGVSTAFKVFKTAGTTLGGFAKTVWTILSSVVTTVGKAFLSIGKVALKGLLSLGKILMANPWIAIATGIIAIIVLVVKNWDKIKEITVNVWNSIKEYMSGLWNSITALASSVWGSLSTYFSNLWNGIKTKASEIWGSMVEVFTSVWTSISTAAQTAWEFIKNVVQFGIMFIVELIRAAFTLITLPFQFIWQNIKEYVFAAWEYIKTAVTNGVNAMVAAIVTFMTPIVQFFVTTWNAVKDGTTAAFNAVKNFLSSVWNSIKSGVEKAWSMILNFLVKTFNSIKDKAVSIFTTVKDKTITVFTAVKNKLTEIWNAIKNSLTKVFNLIKDAAISAWNYIKGKVIEYANAISKQVSAAITGLKNILTGIWNGIKSIASSAWNGIKSVVSGVAESIKSAVTEKFNAVKSKVTEIWNKVKEAIEKPINKAKDAVKKAIDKIKGFMDFKWSLPKLKMPKFSIDGKFSLNPPQVPKMNLKWMATGGIATGASVVGVGEAGDEAIVPLSNKKRMKPFASAVSSMMAKDGGGNNNSEGSGSTVITGNTFVVREEADIKKVAQELHKLEQRERRPKGRG